MVRQFLLVAGLSLGLSAFAVTHQSTKPAISPSKADKAFVGKTKFLEVEASRNDGSYSVNPSKVINTGVQWKRPAGQFWGTGYIPEFGGIGYPYTPLMIRPWVEYNFENISTASGNPSWTVEYWSNDDRAYLDRESDQQNVSQSYLLGEDATVPQLSYNGSQPYPTMYNGLNVAADKSGQIYTITVCPALNFKELTGATNPVSSHYWGWFSRDPQQNYGIASYRGCTPYPGMENGYWFGTNNDGINAIATRFEKPDQPYLLNSVYWYYMFDGDIPNDIPMRAYVFKTANDAAIQTGTNSQGQEFSVEVAELGELIAVSDSFIPAAVFSEEDNFENAVKFEFFEKNQITGAENAYSLEIEDDIIIVVTGFDANPGNGTSIESFISTDEFDEGYGNLGFLGYFDLDESGNIAYDLTAIKNFFSSPLPNTVGAVLADVSYPWLVNYFDEPSQVKLPNEGETTEDTQGLQYALYLLSTSTTDDYEITYNGEEECDWLTVIDVYDEMNVGEDGEEEFTGITGIMFEADPNPNDISRTCEVKISIPAASYNITFLQGSNNDAVEIVGVDQNVIYYDLQGRRVVNPDKGIYIKKSGNKTEKVLL